MLRYANPANFLRLAAVLIPAAGLLSLGLLAVGIYLAFFVAPADYQQGETVRIMYVHVPAAWIALFCWAMMSAAALGTLVWRHPLADAAQKAAAPLGAAFTFVCLATGSLWGKPMWGTWWVWDARLTSVLVLFIMYLGLIALWRAIEEPARAGRAAAILTLVGSVNLPIVKFSVDWWNTLHQPASVFRMGGPTIHPSMLWPLLVMAVAMTLLFLTLHLMATRNEILRRRLRRRVILAAEAGEARASAPQGVAS
jgi:heme exporter protein C